MDLTNLIENAYLFPVLLYTINSYYLFLILEQLYTSSIEFDLHSVPLPGRGNFLRALNKLPA